MPVRVLIVDDDASMRIALKEIIQANGWELAGEATSGGKGIEKYLQVKPDITIMDIVMPGVNGIEATKEIVRRDPAAHIIICSLLNQEAVARVAVEAGAKDFLIKPFKAHNVVQIIKKILASRG